MRSKHWMPALAAAAAFAWGEAALCWIWPPDGLQPTIGDLLLSWGGWSLLVLPALHPKGERFAAGLVLALVLPALLGSPWWALLGLLLAAALPKLALGLFALSGVAWSAQLPRSPEPAPGQGADMLLLTVDTLRADHGGRLGIGPPTQAVSAAPWTLPAMDSLLQGSPVSEHGGGLLTSTGYSRPDGVVLAERLKAVGLSTQAYTCNPHLRPELGFARGFDRFVHSDQWRDPSLLRHLVDERVHRWGGPVPRLWRQRDVLLIEHAQRALEGPPQGRFVWLHILGPHEFLRDPVPGFEGSPRDQWPHAYAASVERTGERLQGLLDGLSPDTRVLILSDHGESLGEQDLYGHGSALVGPQLLVPAWTPGLALPEGSDPLAAWELPGFVFLDEPLLRHTRLPVAGVRRDPLAAAWWTAQGLDPMAPADPASPRFVGEEDWDAALQALGYREPDRDRTPAQDRGPP